MEHLTLKAVTKPVTDEGVFEAVISTANADRELDIVEPAAMVAALKKWNRPIPLSWDHSTAPEDIIGAVEPMTVREQDGEVIVGGQVDLQSAKGAEAWRSFKSGTVGFSYGYLTTADGVKARKGGGRTISALDVFEITATPTPMNNDTRVLQVKALQDHVEKLEARVNDLEGTIGALEVKAAAAAQPAGPPVQEATRQDVRPSGPDVPPERQSPQEPDPHADLVAQWRALTMESLRR